MTFHERRDGMVRFLVGRLEDSLLYDIELNEENCIIAREKPAFIEYPRTICIITHADKMTIENFERLQHTNNSLGRFAAHVFYKDGETFFVRLAERGHIKSNKALKYYKKEQRDAMIHLRDLEKNVAMLFHTNANTGPKIVYYQPGTRNLGGRLDESIRIYQLNDVILDYSHIPSDDRRHIYTPSSVVSLDYKLPVEIGTITGPLSFRFDNTYLMRALICALAQPIKPSIQIQKI